MTKLPDSTDLDDDPHPHPVSGVAGRSLARTTRCTIHAGPGEPCFPAGVCADRWANASPLERRAALARAHRQKGTEND